METQTRNQVLQQSTVFPVGLRRHEVAQGACTKTAADANMYGTHSHGEKSKKNKKHAARSDDELRDSAKLEGQEHGTAASFLTESFRQPGGLHGGGFSQAESVFSRRLQGALGRW